MSPGCGHLLPRRGHASNKVPTRGSNTLRLFDPCDFLCVFAMEMGFIMDYLKPPWNQKFKSVLVDSHVNPCQWAFGDLVAGFGVAGSSMGSDVEFECGIFHPGSGLSFDHHPIRATLSFESSSLVMMPRFYQMVSFLVLRMSRLLQLVHSNYRRMALAKFGIFLPLTKNCLSRSVINMQVLSTVGVEQLIGSKKIRKSTFQGPFQLTLTTMSCMFGLCELLQIFGRRKFPCGTMIWRKSLGSLRAFKIILGSTFAEHSQTCSLP